MQSDERVSPPSRLRRLVSWQVSKIATLGTRLTVAHMPLSARADFAVLAALDETGASSQIRLGRSLGLDRNDVNGIVTRLSELALVDRQIDQDDRRRNVVSITSAGRKRLEELEVHADAVQDELLTALTADERRQLSALLAKVLDGHSPQSA